MARPRATFPKVCRRRYRHVTILRVWWSDRWQRVGTLGDDDATVRARVLALMNADAADKAALRDPEGLSVAGLFAAYLRSPDGPKDKRDRDAVKRAGTLLHSFHRLPLAELTILKLEAWRDWLCTVPARRSTGGRKGLTVEAGHPISHQYIVKLLAWTRRVLRWGVKHGLAPAVIGNARVSPPSPGRARQAPPVLAADPDAVARVLKLLRPEVRDMLRLHRGTGMRPGELCRMRPSEIHRGGVVMLPDGQSVDLREASAGGCWLYVPEDHKLKSRRLPLVVVIPKSCQSAVKPYLKRDPCFAVSIGAYRQAVRVACRRAGVKRIVPLQIRHLVGTETARAGGIHAVRQRLGHQSIATSARYCKVDLESVFRIVK